MSTILLPAFVDIGQSACGWRCVTFLLLCLVLHAFFELASVAIVRARRSRIDELESQKYHGASRARTILGRSEQYLLCCQFWSFLTAFVSGAVALALLLPAVTSAWTEEAFGIWPIIASICTYLLIPAVLVSVAILLVQIAKSIAYAKPNRTLCYVSFLLMPFKYVSLWIVLFLHWVSIAMLKGLRLKTPEERDYAVTAAEINEIVERSSRAGTIEEDEHEMIKSVLEFSDTVASEVMTPRQDVIAIPSTATLADILKVFEQEGHTRILVYGRDLDDFKGIINAKDFLPLAASGLEVEFILSEYIRQVPAITGSLPIQQVLSVLRKQSVHFAVVLDEHGGLDGIITVEDIIEQVVGDIFDEYDVPEDEKNVTETKSGDLVFDGGALIDDINAEYELDLPEGEYDTIAGFIIHSLGRIPQQGDSLEYAGYLISAEDVASNRVNTVKLRFKKNIARNVA